MPLGKKTKAFFKLLEEEAKASPAVALQSIPILTLRKANNDAFKIYSEALPMDVSEIDFKKMHVKITPSTMVSLVTYTPPGYNPNIHPTVVFFYGGGFVIDLLSAHFSGIAKFAKQSTIKVIAVDYPLAPEYKSDVIPCIAYETVKHIFQNGTLFDINAKNFNLVGYSSGGNLAAGVVYQNILNEQNISINRLVLINPWLDLSFKIHKKNPFLKDQNLDKMLTTEVLEYFASLYINCSDDPKAPHISPLFIEDDVLAQFPMTHILSAQYDCLRGTVHAFKERLAKAGVNVTEEVFEGQTHNYFIARNVMDDGEDPANYVAKIFKK